MSRPVPKCQNCSRLCKGTIVEGGALHDFCGLADGRRIKSTAKGQTSPKWCPKRSKEEK